MKLSAAVVPAAAVADDLADDPVEPVAAIGEDADDADIVEEPLSQLERNLVEMVMTFNTGIVDASTR